MQHRTIRPGGMREAIKYGAPLACARRVNRWVSADTGDKACRRSLRLAQRIPPGLALNDGEGTQEGTHKLGFIRASPCLIRASPGHAYTHILEQPIMNYFYYY